MDDRHNRKNTPESRWRQYKTDFLRRNRCTEQEFNDAYVSFMENAPKESDYREFARAWQITIHYDTSISLAMQVFFSVNIAAIKVLARTYDESVGAMEAIFR